MFGVQAAAGGMEIEAVALDVDGHDGVQAVRCSWKIVRRISSRRKGSVISNNRWRMVSGTRLADQGEYLASESTIYRLLRQEAQLLMAI